MKLAQCCQSWYCTSVMSTGSHPEALSQHSSGNDWPVTSLYTAFPHSALLQRTLSKSIFIKIPLPVPKHKFFLRKALLLLIPGKLGIKRHCIQKCQYLGYFYFKMPLDIRVSEAPDAFLRSIQIPIVFHSLWKVKAVGPVLMSHAWGTAIMLYGEDFWTQIGAFQFGWAVLSDNYRQIAGRASLIMEHHGRTAWTCDDCSDVYWIQRSLLPSEYADH